MVRPNLDPPKQIDLTPLLHRRRARRLWPLMVFWAISIAALAAFVTYALTR